MVTWIWRISFATPLHGQALAQAKPCEMVVEIDGIFFANRKSFDARIVSLPAQPQKVQIARGMIHNKKMINKKMAQVDEAEIGL